MSNTLRLTLTIILVIILLMAAVLTIASILFNHQTSREADAVLRDANPGEREIVQLSDLDELPLCVKKWMERSGVVGKEKIHTVHLKQVGRMRTGPGRPWMPVEAEQYINVDQPGFVWKAKSPMAPLLNMLVRDMYFQGNGSMQVKLLGLIPVVDAKPGKEMNQSAMLRYLAEMVWYPTAALNNYIQWQEINTNSARAVMTWQGVTASMVFQFDKQGDLINGIGSRYQEVNGKFVLNDWGGVARGYREFEGIRLQNKTDVIWKYKSGDFNWLQIEVTDIEFN